MFVSTPLVLSVVAGVGYMIGWWASNFFRPPAPKPTVPKTLGKSKLNGSLRDRLAKKNKDKKDD